MARNILIMLFATILTQHLFAQSALGELDEIHYSDSERVVEAFRLKRQAISDFNTQLGPTTTPVISVATKDQTPYYDIMYKAPEDGGADYWIDLDASGSKVVRHRSLQNAHRLAVKIKIDFKFLFYGHMVEHVTIATGGFLYMSDFLHSFLTASQYIAPLMANFDTSINANESEIAYRMDDEVIVVQWSKVHLKDKPELGGYTFQVQLYKGSGKIVTAYKEIPAAIANVSSAKHPVKIGLSDAFYLDAGQYRTIYPYHTYNATAERVQNNSAIIYEHRQTCNMVDNCDQCLNFSPEGFKCYWCSALNRCSDSYDRQRQEWISKGCVYNTTQTDCDMMFDIPKKSEDQDEAVRSQSNSGSQPWKIVTGALCTIFALAALAILVGIIYGYRNPHSPLGMFLVQNRPSELWRKFKVWKNKEEESSDNMHQI